MVKAKLFNNNLKKPRVWEIDVIRAICIIFMIVDHFLYDVLYFGELWAFDLNYEGFFYKFYEFADWYWLWDIRDFFWKIIVSGFFITSGISSTFSKSNFNRGCKIAILAVALSLFTYIAEYELNFTQVFIKFGVLHCFASVILIGAAFNYILKKIKSQNVKYIICSLLLIFSLIIIKIGFYYYDNFLDLTEEDTLIKYLVYSYPFYSADYFPLFPFLGLYFIGLIIGFAIYKNKNSVIGYGDSKLISPLKFIGRHALVIYIIHQAIIFSAFIIIGICLNLPI